MRFSKRMTISACAALMVTFIVSACIPMGGTDFPKPDNGFTPKLTYAVSEGQAYQSVVAALNANAIPIASGSPATGQITTDYIAGKSQLVGLGLVSADHTRYKYTVFIASHGKKLTSITVSCFLEISQSATSGSTPFHDVSGENQEQVALLKNWLYQKIEQQLAP
ncbi:MAG TPA: hypothetical protein VHW02_11520 [Rhizomicrobium sp.]|jgi:hypothetical protein|nr:hypothetical protein [Rhizomicrobium sp.]